MQKQSKRFNKIYVEIGNVCNLSCSFCPKLKRDRRQMTAKEYGEICKKISPYTDYVYLHLMGEPLCHPELSEILDISEQNDLRVCITTNGTLLSKRGALLLNSAKNIHKISISLHCIEGNDIESRLAEYIEEVISFSKEAVERGIYTVLRLWNLDSGERNGANAQNAYIENRLREEFAGEWKKRWNGYTLANRIFLEYAEIFVWPDESEAEQRDTGRCRGLVDQIGILADGTVVPCCLDSEGSVSLGNAFSQDISEIINSERAKNILDGFLSGEMREELCKKCSFAHRFS